LHRPGNLEALPVNCSDHSTALRECLRITTSNGAVLACSVGTPFTIRDRATAIALDMLGHYALTDNVFETPGWSNVVMVEPQG